MFDLHLDPLFHHQNVFFSLRISKGLKAWEQVSGWAWKVVRCAKLVFHEDVLVVFWLFPHHAPFVFCFYSSYVWALKSWSWPTSSWVWYYLGNQFLLTFLQGLSSVHSTPRKVNLMMQSGNLRAVQLFPKCGRCSLKHVGVMWEETLLWKSCSFYPDMRDPVIEHGFLHLLCWLCLGWGKPNNLLNILTESRSGTTAVSLCCHYEGERAFVALRTVPRLVYLAQILSSSSWIIHLNFLVVCTDQALSDPQHCWAVQGLGCVRGISWRWLQCVTADACRGICWYSLPLSLSLVMVGLAMRNYLGLFQRFLFFFFYLCGHLSTKPGLLLNRTGDSERKFWSSGKGTTEWASAGSCVLSVIAESTLLLQH